ncbi:unnamed protein product [Ectocarpus sp. 13 AM-2016]
MSASNVLKAGSPDPSHGCEDVRACRPSVPIPSCEHCPANHIKPAYMFILPSRSWHSSSSLRSRSTHLHHGTRT